MPEQTPPKDLTLQELLEEINRLKRLKPVAPWTPREGFDTGRQTPEDRERLEHLMAELHRLIDEGNPGVLVVFNEGMKTAEAEARLPDLRGSGKRTLEPFYHNIRRELIKPEQRAGSESNTEAQSGVPAQAEEEPEIAAAVNTSPKTTDTPPLEKLPAKKHDYSRYLDAAKLTPRQRECACLRMEYELSITEVARRVNLNRKTVDEHIRAAQKKIDQSMANEKHAKDKGKSGAP